MSFGEKVIRGCILNLASSRKRGLNLRPESMKTGVA